MTQGGSAGVALAAARSLLARRPDGSLLPLSSPHSDFNVFGVEVANYMAFVVYTARVFGLAALLNFGNVLANLDGAHSTDLHPTACAVPHRGG